MSSSLLKNKNIPILRKEKSSAPASPIKKRAKLQQGFKHLYARTVTEYIRHARLERARDLINDKELNNSQELVEVALVLIKKELN